jgi:hypothetical protein
MGIDWEQARERGGENRGQRGPALHADGLVDRTEVRELAALGVDLLGLAMQGQAAFDELELALPHVGHMHRALVLQPHDGGHIGLSIELPPHREDDPHQADGHEQRDDEQRTRDQIAAGLDAGGKGVTERGGDGPEQEEQQRGQSRRGDQNATAHQQRAVVWRWGSWSHR